MPAITAIMASAVAMVATYSTYTAKQQEIRADELENVTRILYEKKEISSEQAKFLLDIARKSGVTLDGSPFMNLLQGIADNDIGTVAAATEVIIEKFPEAADSFVESAPLLNENVNSGIKEAINRSSFTEERKSELAGRIEFQNLLKAIEDAPKNERLDAIERLRQDWQREPGFVETLIDACKGKVQVETEQGINIRLINTMDILRKLDPDVLSPKESLVRSWLEENVLGKVGPNTTAMATSLQNRLDEVTKGK